MIALSAGDWRATLRPGLGGAITALSWRGRDVLRPTPDDASDPLQVGCFPLVPYANRIDRGRFTFNGQAVRLPPTPGFEPHVLHGDGWRRPWSVEVQDAGSATLILMHEAGDWPWAWTARQLFVLDDDGLNIALTLTNDDARPMPAGLGLHPYFVRSDGVRLAMTGETVWTGEGGLIPTRLQPSGTRFDWSDGPCVAAAPFVDNAYAGWDGVARILEDGRTITLEASANAGWAHVFVPVGEAYFCVEPVTHRPDALNAPAEEASGVTVLRPGEAMTLTLRIGAV